MLSVDIEKIVPVTEARDMFNKIVDEVEGSDNMYVLTKNGKPAAVVVGVNHLEKLTGETSGEIMAKVDQAKTETSDDETGDNTSAESISAPVVPPTNESAPAAPTTPSTDAFAAPTAPDTSIPSSNFNAPPTMPEETPTVAAPPDPMAPVIDGDAKPDTQADNQPVTPPTPSSDPFAAPKTANVDTSGGHNPTPGAAGNTNATLPITK